MVFENQFKSSHQIWKDFVLSWYDSFLFELISLYWSRFINRDDHDLELPKFTNTHITDKRKPFLVISYTMKQNLDLKATKDRYIFNVMLFKWNSISNCRYGLISIIILNESHKLSLATLFTLLVINGHHSQ